MIIIIIFKKEKKICGTQNEDCARIAVFKKEKQFANRESRGEPVKSCLVVKAARKKKKTSKGVF